MERKAKQVCFAYSEIIDVHNKYYIYQTPCINTQIHAKSAINNLWFRSIHGLSRVDSIIDTDQDILRNVRRDGELCGMCAGGVRGRSARSRAGVRDGKEVIVTEHTRRGNLRCVDCVLLRRHVLATPLQVFIAARQLKWQHVSGDIISR